MSDDLLQENYDRLKEIAIKNGMSLFGVADIEGLQSEFKIEPIEVYDGLKYGISIGYHLSDRVLESIIDKPTQMYLFHYKRVNALLDEATLKLVAYIQDQGYDALPIHASQVSSWTPPMTGHVSHKMIARFAGLGWIGRSILLVNPTYGGRVRYATILTDMPLKVDGEKAGDCGSCRKCISACPAGAIKEKPADFDLNACYQQLDIFRKKENLGQHICGLCVKACSGKRR
ncbi:TPA: epoxyqueuosine reductase [bacterium]|nr:epoxyqueuosine reductase [bacterium]